MFKVFQFSILLKECVYFVNKNYFILLLFFILNTEYAKTVEKISVYLKNKRW